MKIGIAGAPSSGKTSLSQKLKLHICKHYNKSCYHVTEAATDFILKYDAINCMLDQLVIFLNQYEKEKNANEKSKIIISDAPLFLNYLYAINFNKTISDSIALSKLYEWTLYDLNSCNIIIFLKLDKFTNNGIRRDDQNEAQIMDKRIEEFLKSHYPNYIHGDKYKSIDYFIEQIQNRCGEFKCDHNK